MGQTILEKTIPRLRTQRGNKYPTGVQYGYVKIQDVAIPIGIDVEIEVIIREFDKTKPIKGK